MTPESIQELYDYTCRTFDKVWNCIMQLTDEQFVQDLDYSTGSIRNHVVHLMGAEHRWMKRIQMVEVPPQFPFTDYTTRAQFKPAYDRVQADVRAYVGSLTQADLQAEVTYSLPHRGIMDIRHKRWELLLHVANHATDHRAQILAMLNTKFGIVTVEQDFLFYLLDKS